MGLRIKGGKNNACTNLGRKQNKGIFEQKYVNHSFHALTVEHCFEHSFTMASLTLIIGAKLGSNNLATGVQRAEATGQPHRWHK